MESGACFICSEMITYNSCPICYKCSQAYKRAIIECISDIKKDDARVDNKEIASRLGDEKYEEIVKNYLSSERLAGSYNTVIPSSKIQKATNYLYNVERVSNIINELLCKGILMINENGNFAEVSEDMIEKQRRETMTNYNRQAARQDFMDIKRQLTNSVKNNPSEKNVGSGMFTGSFENRKR